MRRKSRVPRGVVDGVEGGSLVLVKLSINNHIVGLVHKNHFINEIPGIE